MNKNKPKWQRSVDSNVEQLKVWERIISPTVMCSNNWCFRKLNRRHGWWIWFHSLSRMISAYIFIGFFSDNHSTNIRTISIVSTRSHRDAKDKSLLARSLRRLLSPYCCRSYHLLSFPVYRFLLLLRLRRLLVLLDSPVFSGLFKVFVYS